jgi:hypothetical protein
VNITRGSMVTLKLLRVKSASLGWCFTRFSVPVSVGSECWWMRLDNGIVTTIALLGGPGLPCQVLPAVNGAKVYSELSRPAARFFLPAVPRICGETPGP